MVETTEGTGYMSRYDLPSSYISSLSPVCVVGVAEWKDRLREDKMISQR